MSGSTTTVFDANGNATVQVDSLETAKNVEVVSDYAGRTYTRRVNGKTERYFFVNGNQVGNNAGRGAADLSGSEQSQADPSDAYYTAISDRYPGNTPSSYTVQQGDTLRAIAYASWGDPNLWYLIAEANGISNDSQLATMAGRLIDIPNKVVNLRNSVETYKPYNAGNVLGSGTPELPLPPPAPSAAAAAGGGCGGLGKILVIAIAVVATVVTAGAAAVAMGAMGVAGAAGATSMGVWAAGTAALSGGFGVGVGIAAGAVGAAVGSIASQGAGIALGMQESFSWKQVAQSAVAGGISGGVAGYLEPVAAGADGLVLARRAALSSALSQGVMVVTGMQNQFNWRSVAASAAGAAAGNAASQAAGNALLDSGWDASVQQLAQRSASGLAAGIAAAAVQGGRVVIQQIATDAFGNALGESIADNMQPAKTQGVGPYSLADYGNGSDSSGLDQLASRHNAAVVANASAAGENLAPTLQNSRRLGMFLTDGNGALAANDRAALATLLDAGITEGTALSLAPRVAATADLTSLSVSETFAFGSGGRYPQSAMTPSDWALRGRWGGMPTQVEAFDNAFAQTGMGDGANKIAVLSAVREQLVDTLPAQIQTLGPNQVQDREYLTRMHRAMVSGLLATDVYFEQSIPQLMPKGYSRLTGSDLPAGLSFSEALLHNPAKAEFPLTPDGVTPQPASPGCPGG